MVPHRSHLAQCLWTALAEFSHHLLCKWSMTVSVKGYMPLKVPGQDRRMELMELQLIKQSAEEIRNKKLAPEAESRSEEVRLT